MVQARTALERLVAIWLLTGTAAGQEPAVFSAESDLVVLSVAVRDDKGRPVGTLPQEAFAVLEDGRRQAIQFFAGEDQPATIGLIVDGSGSMQPNRERVLAAIEAFAQARGHDDQMFAMTFNDTVRTVMPAAHPFTHDAEVLRRGMAATLGAAGRSALYDGIAAGLDYVRRGRHQRHVLVVVSDGGDNASEISHSELLSRIRASNAVIYTVALVDPAEPDANPGRLKRIAEASGGKAFTPDKAVEIPAVLQRIARDIQHAYTVAYVSTNDARDGAFRRIRVIVNPPDRRRLEIRTRHGYTARLTPGAGGTHER
jgi:Ca-activated chloride channel family protein